MVSIIIPAHNERMVIERCLKPLIEGIDSGILEVIVVCNNCSDGTEEVVKGLDRRVIAISTDIASKINALNMGDEVASHKTRIYLDADVTISFSDLKSVIEVLTSGDYLAASPRIHYDLSKSNLGVKVYYRFWMNTPYFNNGTLGCGFYGISDKGRERFGVFPDIIADDEYVRLNYNPEERITVIDAEMIVYPPRNIKDLIKIKTRAYYGNIELAKRFPELNRNENKGKRNYLSIILKKPVLILYLPFYLMIRVLVKTKGRKRLRTEGNNRIWDRDDSSRV